MSFVNKNIKIFFFKISNRVIACQRGFLLLEAMVTLCILAALMMFLTQWYVQYARMQTVARQRMQALFLGNLLMNNMQAARKVPECGTRLEQGHKITVVARQDPVVKKFYWVHLMLVPSHALSEDMVQLVSGIMT